MEHDIFLISQNNKMKNSNINFNCIIVVYYKSMHNLNFIIIYNLNSRKFKRANYSYYMYL